MRVNAMMESEVLGDWFFNPYAKNNFSIPGYHVEAEYSSNDVSNDVTAENNSMTLDEHWSSCRVESGHVNEQNSGREFASQSSGRGSNAEESVLKHLLTDEINTYKRVDQSSEYIRNKCDRSVDIEEALGTVGWEEDFQGVILCNVSYDVANDNCLRSLSNGYYSNDTDIAHVIQSHSPKSAQTLSQLNGSDDVSSLLDDVTCSQTESRDFMTSHPTSFLDTDSSMADSYLSDLDPQRHFMDCQGFDEVMCVDEENNNISVTSGCRFDSCLTEQNLATHDRRPKCSRRRSREGDDEERYSSTARERKISDYSTPAFTKEHLGCNGVGEIRTSNQKVSQSRSEDGMVRDDGRRMFLEDHRYSSRRLSGGGKSLVRSGSHELPLFTAAGLQKHRPTQVNGSKTSLYGSASSQAACGHPTSALESFLRARHTLNPNKGSDALLTDTMPYFRFESQTSCPSRVQSIRPLVARVPVLSRSLSVPTTNGSLPSSPSCTGTSTTCGERNTSRLLHRLLTGEVDEDACRPVSPSSEEVSTNNRAELKHSSTTEPLSPNLGVLPFVDIAKELANEMLDYSIMFNDDIATELDDDEGSIQFSADLIDTDLDHLFDVELKLLTYSGVSDQKENRTSSAICTDDNPNKELDEDLLNRKLLPRGHGFNLDSATGKPATTVTATTTTTTAAECTSDTRVVEDEQEIWFMRYFDNLF